MNLPNKGQKSWILKEMENLEKPIKITLKDESLEQNFDKSKISKEYMKKLHMRKILWKLWIDI